MIKAIIKFFRDFWEKEIDYTVEVEFSVYELVGLVVLIVVGLLLIFR